VPRPPRDRQGRGAVRARDRARPRRREGAFPAHRGDAQEVVARYEQRLAEAPEDVRWHRLLAGACLAANDHERALAVISAGLALAPEDHALFELRGEAKARTGDVDGALADWQRGLDPDGHSIGART
jgi:regulator of sirC expression with transglutaminase-like and TPR domain